MPPFDQLVYKFRYESLAFERVLKGFIEIKFEKPR
jgi:hypothetical protein